MSCVHYRVQGQAGCSPLWPYWGFNLAVSVNLRKTYRGKEKFLALLLLQGKVANQKHHPLYYGYLMLIGQVKVRAPQLLPGLVHTHNPRFHENIFIAELALLFEFLIALYTNYMGYFDKKKIFYEFFLLNLLVSLKKI